MESRSLELTERQDISNVKGLVHARHVFLEDASYDWNQRLSSWDGWQYAVMFEGKRGHTYVMLDLNNGVAGSDKDYGGLRLNPKTAGGWKTFIGRYFPEEAAKPAKSPAKSK